MAALTECEQRIDEAKRHAMLQIKMAASGAVSGRLKEWPHLSKALRDQGLNLDGNMRANEVVKVCKNVIEASNALVQVRPAGPREACFWSGAPQAVAEKASPATNCYISNGET